MTDPWLPQQNPVLTRPAAPIYGPPAPPRRPRTWLVVLIICGVLLLVAALALSAVAVAVNGVTRSRDCAGVPAEGAFRICGPLGGDYEVKPPLGWEEDRERPATAGYLGLVSGYGPGAIDVYVRNAHAVPADLDRLAKQIRVAEAKAGARVVDPVRFTTSNNRRVALWQETADGDRGSTSSQLVAVLLFGDSSEYLIAVYSENPDRHELDVAERKLSELLSNVRPLN